MSYQLLMGHILTLTNGGFYDGIIMFDGFVCDVIR